MAETEILSHWSHLIGDLHGQSSQAFYAALEKRIDLQEIAGVDVGHVWLATGAAFAGSREYLRVRRHEYVFDLCAAPFGKGFFVSWWLVREPGCLSHLAAIPLLGWFVRWLITRETYYR